MLIRVGNCFDEWPRLKRLILRIRKKGLVRYVRRASLRNRWFLGRNEIKLIFGSAKRDMPTRLHGSSSLSVLMELRDAELPAIKAWSIPSRREGRGVDSSTKLVFHNTINCNKRVMVARRKKHHRPKTYWDRSTHSRCSLVRGDPRFPTFSRDIIDDNSARNFRIVSIFSSKQFLSRLVDRRSSSINPKNNEVQFQFRPTRNDSPTNLHQSWKIQQRVSRFGSGMQISRGPTYKSRSEERMLSSFGREGKSHRKWEG